jgi:hypothetical protein
MKQSQRSRREHEAREVALALDGGEDLRERVGVPARPDGQLLEVRDGVRADRARHLGVEVARMDERAVDAGRDRAVEAADHDAVHRLGRVRRRDPDHRDAPARIGEQLPHRRHRRSRLPTNATS